MTGTSTFTIKAHAPAQLTGLELVGWTDSPATDSKSHARAQSHTLELRSRRWSSGANARAQLVTDMTLVNSYDVRPHARARNCAL